MSDESTTLFNMTAYKESIYNNIYMLNRLYEISKVYDKELSNIRIKLLIIIIIAARNVCSSICQKVAYGPLNFVEKTLKVVISNFMVYIFIKRNWTEYCTVNCLWQ